MSFVFFLHILFHLTHSLKIVFAQPKRLFAKNKITEIWQKLYFPALLQKTIPFRYPDA